MTQNALHPYLHFVLLSIGVFLSFIVAYAAVFGIIAPLERRLLPGATEYASVVFLPHGVRIIATWFYRWKAIPALFAGQIVVAHLRYDLAPTGDLVMHAAVSAVAAYIAFALLSQSGRAMFFTPGHPVKRAYLSLFLAGLLASVINSSALLMIAPGRIYTDQLPATMLIHIVGDNIGLFALFLMFMLAFRLQGRFS